MPPHKLPGALRLSRRYTHTLVDDKGKIGKKLGGDGIRTRVSAVVVVVVGPAEGEQVEMVPGLHHFAICHRLDLPLTW